MVISGILIYDEIFESSVSEQLLRNVATHGISSNFPFGFQKGHRKTTVANKMEPIHFLIQYIIGY